MHKKFYNPLPDGLTIKKSSIHGLGLFTTKDFKKNHRFGTIHIIHFDKVIRTPLGGFINHSDKPNCVKKMFNNRYFLKTLRDIEKGEELTLSYEWYKI